MAWSLVVLAAGKGSRFGGPKQLAPVGPADEPLMVVSMEDAIAAGCTAAVIVTRDELVGPITESLRHHLRNDLPLQFITQNSSDLPVPVEASRDKPWGTAHALWSARRLARTHPMVVINADDYYGRESIRLAGAGAQRLSPGRAMLVAYRLANTLSESGGVSRAICEIANGFLSDLRETYDINQQGRRALGNRDGQPVDLALEAPVSINLWSFHPTIFELLEAELTKFLEQANLQTDEFGLPQAVQAMIHARHLAVDAVISHDRWLGLTYQDDLPAVREALAGRQAQ